MALNFSLWGSTVKLTFGRATTARSNERKPAQVSEQDDNGNTALHEAFLENRYGSVIILLMGKYLMKTTRNLSNEDGLSFLHIACTTSYVDVVKKVLLDERVNVDGKVNQVSTSIYAGYAPLHFAVKFNQREVAELLITRYHASLYDQDAKGSTPIHLALELGNVAMLDLLLTHEWRLDNVVNDQGLTHFMAACAGSNELIVEEYLQSTAASQMINDTVKRFSGYRFAGYTPLRFALEFKRVNTTRLLKNRGAKNTAPFDFSGSRAGGDAPSSRSESHESSDGNQSICAWIIGFGFGMIATGLLFLGVRSVDLK